VAVEYDCDWDWEQDDGGEERVVGILGLVKSNSIRSSIRSDAPEQPELCPHELDSNGAELDLFEFELSEPTGSGAVMTLASLPISGLFERLPTENARTLLASCGVMSNLPCKQQSDATN
jgi:hypothetical protein